MFKSNCLQPFAYKNTSNITQMYKVFRYKKKILVLQEHQGSLQVLKTYSYGTTNMYLFQAKFPFCVEVLVRIWGYSSPCLCFATQAIKQIKKIKEAYNVQIQSAKIHNLPPKQLMTTTYLGCKKSAQQPTHTIIKKGNHYLKT